MHEAGALALTPTTAAPMSGPVPERGSAGDAHLPFADPQSAATLDLTVQATADWLADRPDHARAAHLEGIRSWLSHCQKTHVNPLTATPWDVIYWVSTSKRSETSMPPAKRAASVRLWYAHLVQHRVCVRDPTQGVQFPSGEPARPRVRVHGVLASAVLVDYADARASDDGSEGAWRDAALVAMWFYTEIAPPPLLAYELSALRLTVGELWLVKADSSDRVPLSGHADRLVRGYLERRSARLGRHWEQLRGPLLATTPAEEGGTGDLPLTSARVLIIVRALAEHCGLPHRPRLSAGCAALPGQDGRVGGYEENDAGLVASGRLSVITR
ncbi:hypothetical protein [Streptosporangium sp. V21-05]|uniref:hypothetical protein n=1 Tax=Streptosporangium sp. V21-05 TaxID=3446115 RepID=UPI003F52FFC6